MSEIGWPLYSLQHCQLEWFEAWHGVENNLIRRMLFCFVHGPRMTCRLKTAQLVCPCWRVEHSVSLCCRIWIQCLLFLFLSASWSVSRRWRERLTKQCSIFSPREHRVPLKLPAWLVSFLGNEIPFWLDGYCKKPKWRKPSLSAKKSTHVFQPVPLLSLSLCVCLYVSSRANNISFSFSGPLDGGRIEQFLLENISPLALGIIYAIATILRVTVTVHSGNL